MCYAKACGDIWQKTREMLGEACHMNVNEIESEHTCCVLSQSTCPQPIKL